MENKKVTVTSTDKEFHYNGKAYKPGTPCVMNESEFTALTQTNPERLNLTLVKDAVKDGK